MTSEHHSKRVGWFTGRTRLITVVSIVVVGLAGATAVSANIGILESASDSPVGNASVTGGLDTEQTRVVDVYLPQATTTTVATTAVALSDADPTVQKFAVDVAGTVALATIDTGVRLDEVTPSTGWTWSLAQEDPNALTVTMTNGTRTFEFTATATPDGNIVASVNEPIVSAAPAGNGADYQDDDHDDEHDDHDDQDDDHDEHERYEGGEDDD
jgi:hypothetical protein